jgi:uncharacterized Fe-S cluster protein YjdI
MAMERAHGRSYTNGEITVVWKPDLCVHSTVCFRGLPQVFKPRERPWVVIEAAPSAAIAQQVSRCPSGALSLAQAPPARPAPTATMPEATLIEVRPNGPLVVHGKLRVRTASGEEIERETRASFCRCGGSANKPFCDGSHRTNGFVG